MAEHAHNDQGGKMIFTAFLVAAPSISPRSLIFYFLEISPLTLTCESLPQNLILRVFQAVLTQRADLRTVRSCRARQVRGIKVCQHQSSVNEVDGCTVVCVHSAGRLKRCFETNSDTFSWLPEQPLVSCHMRLLHENDSLNNVAAQREPAALSDVMA